MVDIFTLPLCGLVLNILMFWTVLNDDNKFESANINKVSEKWFYRSFVNISGIKNENNKYG